MIKNLIIILFYCVPFYIQAQHSRLLNDSVTVIGIEAEGGLGSKSITWAFSRAFVTGGNLSRQIRQQVLDNISGSDNL